MHGEARGGVPRHRRSRPPQSPRRPRVGHRAHAHFPQLPRHPRHAHFWGAVLSRSTRRTRSPSRSRGASPGATLGAEGCLPLFLRAYSMGAGTYTGIEAVSNGLHIMREPKVDTAKRTMALMAASPGHHRRRHHPLLPLSPRAPGERQTMNAGHEGRRDLDESDNEHRGRLNGCSRLAQSPQPHSRGGPGAGETVVTYQDIPALPGQLKICKAVAAVPPLIPTGTLFTFVVTPVRWRGVIETVTVPSGSCTSSVTSRSTRPGRSRRLAVRQHHRHFDQPADRTWSFSRWRTDCHRSAVLSSTNLAMVDERDHR